MRLFLVLGLLLLAAAAAAAPAPAADPEVERAVRAAKLGDKGKKDAAGWVGLADFCETNGLWERRVEALRKAVSLDPDHAEARARLDEKRCGNAWLPADEADAQAAAENGAKGLVFHGSRWISATEAEKAREADARAAGWKVGVRVDTAHLKIYSARSLAFTLRLADTLESAIGAYRRSFGKVWKLAPDLGTFTVHLFADRDTFERVARTQGLQISEGDVGKYHVRRGVLYVGMNRPEVVPPDAPDDVVQCAVHEMLHGLDDRLARCTLACPAWRQEGCAVYFGHAVRGRQVLPGVLWVPKGDGFPEALGRAMEVCALSEIMTMDQARFTATLGNERYALAWAFVHFLLHGEGGRYAAGFRSYLASCDTKASKADFEKAVGRLAELEPAFRAYVEGEFLPAAEAGRGPSGSWDSGRP